MSFKSLYYGALQKLEDNFKPKTVYTVQLHSLFLSTSTSTIVLKMGHLPHNHEHERQAGRKVSN